MISMSQTYSIRQLRKSGESISEIARKVGVSRNTVYAKLAAPDLSLQMPVKEPREKKLDAYRPVIEGYLDEDERTWRKQRHEPESESTPIPLTTFTPPWWTGTI